MMQPIFDSTQAMEESWAIFQCFGSQAGDWQLQKLDEERVFDTDDQAWDFVIRKAAEGSEYHLSALRFIREHCDDEFERLVNHAAYICMAHDLRDIL